ncbi:hypothetical protein FIBSPDRAFT_960589 [Athelia psychrophila]|uniref:Uncharacterized protein n=1 Tax=Athelia psychrophila TaxID=1759441 RepID=A0A166C993_9AGAM|nr:hypothetical protein FIBSPDRAFT_960589 [Fibularhizoctonia sp. CBS 109695]
MTVGDCETPFRFWWRDTRLAELPRSLPPSSTTASSFKYPSDRAAVSTGYQFPYPTTFLAVPYFTNTTLPFLSAHIIPLARALRAVSVDVPLLFAPAEPTMDVDGSLPPPQALTSLPVALQSDGLLLYVSQASYEPGTSPLSSWIPIAGYETGVAAATGRWTSLTSWSGGAS